MLAEPMSYRVRTAHHDDIPVLEDLIARSAHGLSIGDYTPEQVAGALEGAFGVDTQLIDDGTYFVIEHDGTGTIVACGGWSYRATLFGGDAHAERDAGVLDPQSDAAKIRAFFVDPAHARRGLGRRLLEHCEERAKARGFRALELMSTLPGQRLYAACGFVAGDSVDHDLGQGQSIRFVPMRKQLGG